MHQSLIGINWGSFPIYQIMLGIGFIAAYTQLTRVTKNLCCSKFYRSLVRGSFMTGLIAALLCANVANWFLFPETLEYPLGTRLTEGGFTFYFGMLGFFAFSAITLRLSKLDYRLWIDIIVPCVLIAQFWGRIGCSLKGCCYGETIELFGNETLFPAREIEALYAFIMCQVLKKHFAQSRFAVYLLSYSVLRFVLEFWRGDNRGSMWGSDLSPTQILALIFGLGTLGYFIYRALLKNAQFKAKHDQLLAKISGSKPMQWLHSNILAKLPKRKPFIPLQLNYTGPTGWKRALINLGKTAGVLTICFCIFTLWNPFNMPWCENLLSGGSISIGSRGNVEELGDTGGTSLIDVSEHGKVENISDAQALFEQLNEATDAEYVSDGTIALPSGNIAYNFAQSTGGTAVIGHGGTVVTDSQGNALYVIEDSAQIVTNNRSGSLSDKKTSAADLFGNDAVIIKQGEYLYENLTGLVPVTLATVTQATDAADSVSGAQVDVLLESGTGNIVAMANSPTASASEHDRQVILSALSRGIELAGTDYKPIIKEIRSGKASFEDYPEYYYSSSINYSDYEEDIAKDMLTATNVQILSRALSEALYKSDISGEKWCDILSSAYALAEEVPNINFPLFREILIEETRSYFLSQGDSSRTADKMAKSVREAFDKVKIKSAEDEAVMLIESGSRSSRVSGSFNYAGDADLVKIRGEKNGELTVEFDLDVPAMVTVYDNSGSTIYSIRMQGEDSLTLPTTHCSDYAIKIAAAETYRTERGKDAKYSVSVSQTLLEDTIPDYIRTKLTRVENAYNNSDLTAFVQQCYTGEEGEEFLAFAYGELATMADSCANMLGENLSYDTAKAGIASTILTTTPDEATLLTLKGSVLELEYITHIDTADGAIVKAAVSISYPDSFELLGGFTYLHIGHREKGTVLDGAEEGSLEYEIALRLASLNSGYYIVDINDESFFGLFGDTKESISAQSRSFTLYEYWKEETVDTGGSLVVPIYTVDREAALADGYTAEELDGFELFTARINASMLNMAYTQYELLYQLSLVTPEDAQAIIFAVGLVTDPIQTLVTTAGDCIVSSANSEDLDAAWLTVKFMADPTGTAIEAGVDEAVKTLNEQSPVIKQQMDSLKVYIDEIYAKIEKME